MSILGSVGYKRYMSKLDYTPILVLQTKPIYRVMDYNTIPYRHLVYTNSIHAPFCPVYYVTGNDTVEHVSGINYKWTETRYFFN